MPRRPGLAPQAWLPGPGRGAELAGRSSLRSHALTFPSAEEAAADVRAVCFVPGPRGSYLRWAQPGGFQAKHRAQPSPLPHGAVQPGLPRASPPARGKQRLPPQPPAFPEAAPPAAGRHRGVPGQGAAPLPRCPATGLPSPQFSSLPPITGGPHGASHRRRALHLSELGSPPSHYPTFMTKEIHYRVTGVRHGHTPQHRPPTCPARSHISTLAVHVPSMVTHLCAGRPHPGVVT